MSKKRTKVGASDNEAGSTKERGRREVLLQEQERKRDRVSHRRGVARGM